MVVLFPALVLRRRSRTSREPANQRTEPANQPIEPTDQNISAQVSEQPPVKLVPVRPPTRKKIALHFPMGNTGNYEARRNPIIEDQ